MVIRHRSVKPDTLAALETRKGKSGTQTNTELVYILDRKRIGTDQFVVVVETNSGRRTLITNSVDASVYTIEGDGECTYRLHSEESAQGVLSVEETARQIDTLLSSAASAT